MPFSRMPFSRLDFKHVLAGFALALTLFDPSTATAQAAASKAITDADVADFAKAAETAFLNVDAKAFSDLFNWDALVDKSTANVDAPEKFRLVFRSGLLKSAGDPNGFSGRIVGQSRAGARYSMLRGRMRDKQKTALFRLAFPNGAGVN